MKTALLVLSHLVCIAGGFALGVYFLPILIAPPAPSAAVVAAIAEQAEFRGEFVRDLPGSDALHWGEGEVVLGRATIAHHGRLAPGPDYQLYLAPEFVDNRAAFMRVKERSVRVGPIQTFENFVVAVPPEVDINAFTAAVVWCESFEQFISAARYR